MEMKTHTIFINILKRRQFRDQAGLFFRYKQMILGQTEPVDNWTSGQLNQWATEPVDNWTSGQLNQWTTEPVDDWTSGQLNQWTTEPVDNLAGGQLNQWQLNQWTMKPVNNGKKIIGEHISLLK